MLSFASRHPSSRLVRLCIGLLLSSSLLQSMVPATAQALDILSFDLASASQPEVSQAIDVAATQVGASLSPLSFDAAPARGSGINLALHQASSQRDELLFEGGANSLVAVAVGHAEGTRTVVGDRTPAYYGHTDPGNGAWNQGSFSYQHRASSPEEADQKQLTRLSRQAADLRQQAQSKGLKLSVLEELSGIDLANQAPLAALDHGGYIDWLQEAKRRQLAANEAIIWARTWSYWDPKLDHWNAPGLGNNLDDIYADQERRHWAVVKATDYFRL